MTAHGGAGDAVADRLRGVRDRIAAACAASGRPAESVRLVAVSKRIPLPLVVQACRAGQWDLGENRVADALDRQIALPTLLREAGLDPALTRWHFVGHLQRNKSRKVGGRFVLLHGVDSLALARLLSRRAVELGITDSLLLEVNISGEAQKKGLAPADLPAALAEVAGLPGLRLAGLMGMARYGAAEPELRQTFASLRRLAEAGRGATGLPLPELSMGMSGDFEAAIAEGATIVRIGGAIFGPRQD